MRWFSIVLILLSLRQLSSTVCAAEIIVRTSDGQTLQGEHLGTADKKVKLRTKYGEISIPEKSIVTISAAPVSEKAAADESVAVKEPAAPAVEDLKFEEVKAPNVLSALATRAGEPRIPSKAQEQELHRAIRNFGDSSDSSRTKIIRSLQSFGQMAYPYIEAAYSEPAELDDRVDLLRSVAVRGQVFNTSILAPTHRRAMAYMIRVAEDPPQLPPEYTSRRNREQARGKPNYLKQAANLALAVEGYAAIAGGPFNALFLLDIYRERYTDEKTDPLLVNSARDAVRLAETAADATKSKSFWTVEDRIQLSELLFPWLFKDNAGMKLIATETLKKVLPSGYPKWDATQTEWVTWWKAAKEKLK